MVSARANEVRLGPPIAGSMVLWVCASMGLHVFALIVSFGVLGGGLIAGHGIEDGDGFGGTSIDFEIRGDPDQLPSGALAPSTAADPAGAPVQAQQEREETQRQPEDGTVPVAATEPQRAQRAQRARPDDRAGEEERRRAGQVAEQTRGEAEGTEQAPRPASKPKVEERAATTRPRARKRGTRARRSWGARGFSGATR